jgi:hypothetical protein
LYLFKKNEHENKTAKKNEHKDNLKKPKKINRHKYNSALKIQIKVNWLIQRMRLLSKLFKEESLPIFSKNEKYFLR